MATCVEKEVAGKGRAVHGLGSGGGVARGVVRSPVDVVVHMVDDPERALAEDVDRPLRAGPLSLGDGELRGQAGGGMRGGEKGGVGRGRGSCLGSDRTWWSLGSFCRQITHGPGRPSPPPFASCGMEGSTVNSPAAAQLATLQHPWVVGRGLTAIAGGLGW